MATYIVETTTIEFADKPRKIFRETTFDLTKEEVLSYIEGEILSISSKKFENVEDYARKVWQTEQIDKFIKNAFALYNVAYKCWHSDYAKDFKESLDHNGVSEFEYDNVTIKVLKLD